MYWKIKAIGLRMLSELPGGRSVYHLLQQRFGGYRAFTISGKLWQAFGLIKAMIAAKYPIEGMRTVEVGTGWVPLIPLIFFVFGQRRCDSFDIEDLLQPSLTLEAAHQIANFMEGTSLIDDPAVRQRVSFLKKANSLSKLLSDTNIYYHAPRDASLPFLPAGSVDIFFSNATLEHIPPVSIFGLFREAHRLLTPDGVMVHLVDCTDHFSHRNNNLDNLNFLRYPEEEWRRYNSNFLYQNRLRPSQYRSLVNEAEFEIILWQTKLRREITKPKRQSVSKEFFHLSAEDLLATRLTMTARKIAG
jgi:SAM-dependent methyltransferase